MDTNETYFKMCERAEALWDGRPFEVGDYHYVKDSEDGKYDGLFIIGTREKTSPDWFDIQIAYGGKHFWLPRQDQLQTMVKQNDESWRALLFKFSKFAMTPRFTDNSKIYFDYVWSPEMLWLSFVMKEIYNQVWNGEFWS